MNKAFIDKQGYFLISILLCVLPACTSIPKGTGSFQDKAEKELGIHINALRIIAAGHIIDLRYRIIDPSKARLFLDPKVDLYLVHSKTGRVLTVPSPPKVGRLRQTPKNTNLDLSKQYFVLFGNIGKSVKPGDNVDLIVDGICLKNIKVD